MRAHNILLCAATIAILCLWGCSCSPELGDNPCSDPEVSKLPFCDYKLDVEARVKDLIGRLNTAEKISQLGHNSPAIPSLKIPAYQWWSEALHGVAGSPGVSFKGQVTAATSFPQVIGLGATFNESLFYMMAEAISTEARAMYNVGQAGLTYFAPNVNIYRDPRWGRGQETPGEDPLLTTTYARQFVQGMQGGGEEKYVKTVVTCKHYIAYDVENYNGTDRHHYNAVVPLSDMQQIYMPAFMECVKQGVWSMMCSYNAVNGTPMCANDEYLNHYARDTYNFQGYIVSDCGAINDIMQNHKYTNTTEATVKAALEGGTDLNCGGFYQSHAQDAYDKGSITDEDLNRAVGRLFTVRIKLGMFDPPDMVPYNTIDVNAVNTTANQMLALEAAEQSIILLQNKNNVLPMDMSKKVALIGPNSKATGTMQGNYKGTAPYLISPMDGLTKMNVSVTQADGCNVACSSDSGFSEAVNVAKNADIVVMVMGLDQGQESEGHDRTDIVLPGMQEQLLDAVKKGISSTTPIIIVLMVGGPVDISWGKTNADAILWVGYPGQSGGLAIAEVLLGVVNPSGKLPYTMYPSDFTKQNDFLNMSMNAYPGRTYQYYTGTPVFAFGDGLSYTTFDFKWTNKSVGRVHAIQSRDFKNMKDSNPVAVMEVEVTNTGKRGGAVTVIAFLTFSPPKNGRLKTTLGFKKVFLDPGMKTTIDFEALAENFKYVDNKGKRNICLGEHHIVIENLKHKVTVY